LKNIGEKYNNADRIHSSTYKYYFVVLLVPFNLIGATMINDILDKKITLQDSLIDLLHISVQLKKLSIRVDERIVKIEEKMKDCDKIISDFEKDMEKEMLDDQKKNNKV
tara:strand:- start:123 stop:449 length:327 start_codon:yes stop_codon:yes gene_type:complete